ncbi:MAG: aminoacyl-tRNA hydrolase, partial [bacterium]|nr:aminoacyl-tRNA hydrolase [bacterium]
TDEFKRIRIGIGNPSQPLSLADFVLKRFPDFEQKQLPAILDLAANRIETGLKNGFDTMTEHAEL